MKRQSLFSGRKNKKNISNCHVLKFLPRVLSVHESLNRNSGSAERPLCDREFVGSILDRAISKNLKVVLAALSLGAWH